MADLVQYYGTGRRKSSIARVFLRPGSGKFTVNKKEADVYFVTPQQRVAARRSLGIAGIEEKPKKPKSNLAVTGIYLYDATVFDKCRQLKPSHRGELEITDVNNAYIREGSMTFAILDGWWTDAGTFDSLLRATNLVASQPRTAAQELANAD